GDRAADRPAAGLGDGGEGGGDPRDADRADERPEAGDPPPRAAAPGTRHRGAPGLWRRTPPIPKGPWTVSRMKAPQRSPSQIRSRRPMRRAIENRSYPRSPPPPATRGSRFGASAAGSRTAG